MKRRKASGVLCEMRIPMGLKGKFYRIVVRPTMLCGSECWLVRENRIRNEYIKFSVGVASIDDKMREDRLRWFGYMMRRK